MIIEDKNFNLKQIADSGQCFRMDFMGEGRYRLITYGRYIELAQITPEQVEIGCSPEDFDLIFRTYFDLDYDYASIVDRLATGKDLFLKRAAEYGSGMRILQQEPFEALISFILSQNRNISMNKRCIQNLSELFGEKKTSREYGVSYSAFPTPEALAKADMENLRCAGLGYRDTYVKKAAQAVWEGTLNLDELKNGEWDWARGEIRKLHGVGEKVACCVSLYGLHHLDAVPQDVWIKRMEKEIYKGRFRWEEYGDYAGIVQQYAFYYIRSGEYLGLEFGESFPK